MSGGKGGSTSSTVEIPQYIEDAARRNLARADTMSRIGDTPYYGPDVAAFTPMQQAAFQNTADTAGAFGLAGGGMSQQNIMGGMPAPTTYAGGVRGYSSAPMYEQAMAELAARRPGQKALIDSLFVDPYSGVAGENVGPVVDYTDTRTPGDLGGGSVGGGGDLVSYPGAGGGSGSALSDAEIADYSQVIADEIGMDSFDPAQTAESQMTPEQYVEYQSQPMSNPAQLGADNIYMNNLGNANSNIVDTVKGLMNIEPSFEGPSSAGSYGGSLVTGGLSGDLTGIPGFTGNIADNIVAAVAPEYAMELQGRNFAESGGSTYDPNMVITNPMTGKTTTGGYNFDPTAFSSDYGVGEIPVGISPATPIPEASVYSTPAISPVEFTSTDFSGEEAPYTMTPPTDVSPPGYVDNTPSTFPEVREYYDSSPLNPPAPAVLKFDDNTSVDLGYDLGPSVAGGRGTIVPGQTTGGGLLSSLDAQSPAPAPTTFEGPIPAGTTLPTGSTIVNTYDGGFESRPSHATDNDRPAGPGDTGYEQAQLLSNLQSGGTGIIYKDDRREVYLDGVLIGKPKRADDAREMLAKAKAAKAKSQAARAKSQV